MLDFLKKRKVQDYCELSVVIIPGSENNNFTVSAIFSFPVRNEQGQVKKMSHQQVDASGEVGQAHAAIYTLNLFLDSKLGGENLELISAQYNKYEKAEVYRYSLKRTS